MKKLLFATLGMGLISLNAETAPTAAPVDAPRTMYVYQNGVQVGVVFRPAPAANQTTAAEHWVVYPNYQYPSARNGMELELVASPTQEYATETDFFRRAPFGSGFRYIQTTGRLTDIAPDPLASRKVIPCI